VCSRHPIHFALLLAALASIFSGFDLLLQPEKSLGISGYQGFFCFVLVLNETEVKEIRASAAIL